MNYTKDNRNEKSVLSLRISENDKESLRRLGNNNITQGIQTALRRYEEVFTASQEIPEWYFNPETVSNVMYYNWARSLENTEKNAKYIKQFWVIASGHLPPYKGNLTLESFIRGMVMDPESPFYLEIVRNALLPLIENWESLLSLKALDDDIGYLHDDIDGLKGQAKLAAELLVEVMTFLEENVDTDMFRMWCEARKIPKNYIQTIIEMSKAIMINLRYEYYEKGDLPFEYVEEPPKEQPNYGNFTR